MPVTHKKRKRRRRPPPQALDTHSRAAGLRAVAGFEALKGILVLLLELGVLTLIHKDAGDVAEGLVLRIHLNPDQHLGRAIIDAADKLTDAKLWAIAAGGLFYAAVRFVEAYGLWNRRVWAQWFALLSGTAYLPWEIYEFAAHPSNLHAAVLLINLVIVIYMLAIRLAAMRAGEDEAPAV